MLRVIQGMPLRKVDHGIRTRVSLSANMDMSLLQRIPISIKPMMEESIGSALFVKESVLKSGKTS
jgi:hypothetical protein